MNDYDRNRIAALLAWRAFARSSGIFTTVIFTLLTLNPVESLGKGVIVWVFFYIFREMTSPQFVDLNLWNYCGSCVLFISLWLTKTLLLILAGIVSINWGAPVESILLVFTGLLLYDLFFVFSHGS